MNLIEIVVWWNFQTPKLITQDDIEFIYTALADEFLSVSHFFSKKQYVSKKGYYVIGKTKLKVRALKPQAGFLARQLMRISIDGITPYSLSIHEVSPSFEGFVYANNGIGEQDYETFLNYVENYYFTAAEKIHDSDYEKKFIPVIKNFKDGIYSIQLFGDPKMIELFNTIGLDFFGKRMFFYHRRELPYLLKISEKPDDAV